MGFESHVNQDVTKLKCWWNQEAIFGHRPTERKLSSHCGDVFEFSTAQTRAVQPPSWECIRQVSASSTELLMSQLSQVLNFRKHNNGFTWIKPALGKLCSSPPRWGYIKPLSLCSAGWTTSTCVQQLTERPPTVRDCATAPSFPNRTGSTEPRRNTFSALGY